MLKTFCKNFILLTICLIVLNIFSGLASCDDQIHDLPGLQQALSYKQYAGHLDASKGRHHFYWFFESQTSPETAPVVLWLNGGPGCSSLTGLFSENGPFRVDSQGKNITLDKFSWNSVANVIYMESPAGVGFSYVDTGVNPNNTDESTALDNYLAIENFFVKYPQFKKNPFYITGESYAGVYIPMMAIEIFKHKSDINFKGVAIGNGAFDNNYLMGSTADFAYSHALMTTESHAKIIEYCCDLAPGKRLSCDYYKNSTECQSAQREYMFPTNLYNIYDDCPPMSLYYQTIGEFLMKTLGNRFGNVPDSSGLYVQDVHCPKQDYTKYLNTPAVRQAIHIPDVLMTKKWVECGGSHYETTAGSQRDNVMTLVDKYKLDKIIIYNGDFDAMCDFIADERFVEDMGYNITENYRAWTVGGRTGGYLKRYNGLSVVVVRAAGHMVPTDQPEAALAILKDLIGLKKL